MATRENSLGEAAKFVGIPGRFPMIHFVYVYTVPLATGKKALVEK